VYLENDHVVKQRPQVGVGDLFYVFPKRKAKHSPTFKTSRGGSEETVMAQTFEKTAYVRVHFLRARVQLLQDRLRNDAQLNN
jgi:hypothetical protein